MPMGNRINPEGGGGLPGERGELDDAAEMEAAEQPAEPLLAEEEAAEAPYHEGEPSQPEGYVQEDYEPIPDPPGAVEVDPDGSEGPGKDPGGG